MSHRPPRRNDDSRSALWIVLLMSLLLHYPIVAGIVTLLDLEDSEPQEPMEVSLLEEDPEPPEPEVSPKPAAPEPPAPKPPQQPDPQTPLPPKPVFEPVEPQLGVPTAPTSPEPLGAPEALEEPAEPELPPEQVELEMDWAVFERAFAEKAEKERHEYQRQSQAKRRGGLKLGSLTGKVKRALHNNSSWVTAGQQEPLGKRKRTFRAYIHAVHDRIHHLFADSFLGSLTSLDPNDPLNDFGLMAKLE
ncbi:MAG: hypothetical protein JRF63_14055, partial [Deltaproteobacteria bacterium]|nr:hypothetical protein [Deltaproteobacteria bacterium]